MRVPAFFPRPEAGTQVSADGVRRRLEEPPAYHTGRACLALSFSIESRTLRERFQILDEVRLFRGGQAELQEAVVVIDDVPQRREASVVEALLRRRRSGWGSPDREPPAAAWTAGSNVARPKALSCCRELMKKVGTSTTPLRTPSSRTTRTLAR